MAHWVQELKKAMTEKTAFVAGVETSTELAPTASIRTLRASERHKKQRMVLLPPRGLRAPSGGNQATASSAFLINLHHGRAAIPNAPAPPRGVRVIDSI